MRPYRFGNELCIVVDAIEAAKHGVCFWSCNQGSTTSVLTREWIRPEWIVEVWDAMDEGLIWTCPDRSAREILEGHLLTGVTPAVGKGETPAQTVKDCAVNGDLGVRHRAAQAETDR